MRKPTLFALGMCAAVQLAHVSFTYASQAESQETQSSGGATSGAQTSGQQGTQTSGQQTATQQNQQTGPQTTSRQSQAPRKQAAGQKDSVARQNQPTGSQTTTRQSRQAEQQSATRQSQPAGKQAAMQNGASARQNQQAGKQAANQKTLPARPLIPPGYRLLTLTEGRGIAQGISWADDEEGLSPDCSHLVHTLYQQAGYPYPYASSLDLYRGTAPFLRVRYAHPGDLVVWRGHVGIVMNPREHSFFSTTSSGARIANYRSAYWRGRGYPHFFRYLTKSPLKTGTNPGTTEAVNQQLQH